MSTRTGDTVMGALFLLMCAVIALIVAALVLGLPIYTFACYHHVRHLTCHVTGKDRTSGSGGSMRVYTSDCGNLEVQDATFRKNFHSSDTYAAIHTGHTYEFTTTGYRIPFLSEFPNIVEQHEVQP